MNWRHTILTLILFCYINGIYAQTNSETKNKWNIGVTFSPDYYFHAERLKTGKHTGIVLARQTTFNFTTGIKGYYNLQPDLKLGTGIFYSKKDREGLPYCNLCVRPAESSSSIAYTQLLKLRYLEIPLFVKYDFSKQENINWHVKGGIISSYSINKTVVKLGKSPSHLLLSGNLGLGINFDINDKINIEITPRYTHSFIDLAKSSEMKFRSIGLSLSGLYHIKN